MAEDIFDIGDGQFHYRVGTAEYGIDLEEFQLHHLESWKQYDVAERQAQADGKDPAQEVPRNFVLNRFCDWIKKAQGPDLKPGQATALMHQCRVEYLKAKKKQNAE